MNEEPIQVPLSSDQLWLTVINEGMEDRVEVNQRMLIDKMLARYSSDFVICRELIQNSDDAQATSFTLQIICCPPTITTMTNSEESNECDNFVISEIRAINNGYVFSDDDWKRAITIAEGNTNVNAIGQFGVGFFSVFAYSERPMIQSGKHCLAFVWQNNGKSLTTFRKELPIDQQSSSTSIILPMKDKYILQTKPIKSSEIVPMLDLIQLKAYFTKVLSFTKYINELIIQMNDTIVFHVTKTRKSSPSTPLNLAEIKTNADNEYQLLCFQSSVHTEQTFHIISGPSMTLNHLDIEATVVIDEELNRHIENVLKKRLPSLIHLEFLYPSINMLNDESWKTLTKNDLLKNLIPLRFDDGDIVPSGQIFIGLATHQTTGIGMHIFSHLIPTIERENIDLQDPYISIWNEQLLRSMGSIIRLIYDQTIVHVVNNNSSHHPQYFNAILSLYAFQTSSPNTDIGRFLLDGFFASNKDILVPVRQHSSDTRLALIASSKAYLSYSKLIETFLPLSLVPFDIGQNDFFKMLKRRQLIREIDDQTIATNIHESILTLNELIGLLRWLCTNDSRTHNSSYIKEILSEIYYRDTDQSPIIQLEKVEFYDTLNITCLPLPTNVLPSNIVSHLSREDLQRRLSLSEIPMKKLIEFYLLNDQQYLFEKELTSRILLHSLSQHWAEFNENEFNRIKNILAKVKCIATSQGMKFPSESYLPSSNLSDHLPTIEQSIEYPLSTEFLKTIGCRTLHLPTMGYSPSAKDQTLESFIQDLLQQRPHMSETDLDALRNNSCLTGTTLESHGEIKRQYKPHELHFPSVAIRLQWNQLPILNWMAINPFSPEYSLLKELGVREVPDLHQLISRIVDEHDQGVKSRADYQLPHALVFFAEYYSKSWKNAQIKTAFLPSSPPEMINPSTDVILTTPEFVFKEINPLCPSLLPEVLQCFSQYFDIDLLGVKYRPSLEIAFDILLNKQPQFLTIKSAPMYFSYLNKLDGFNRALIQSIANRSFIPVNDSAYVKPSQVFIRSKSSFSLENVNTLDDVATRGLIDYVDYGPEANSFLFRIGVLSYPSAEILAELLIERQASYFSPNNKFNTDEMITAKLRIYTNCLKQLAVVPDIAQQFNFEPLRSRLTNQPWCLAYQIIDRFDGNKERIFQIARPEDIYLDDDHQSAIDLQPLCAPDEPELTKLYAIFGSKWLSESVKRTLIHQGNFFTTDRSEKLHDLIHYRLDMLFVNNRGEYLENIDQKCLELLRTKLFVYEAETIQCQLTFQSRTLTLSSTNCSSCALEHERNVVRLFIHKDIPTFDYIDIATELTRFVHKKPLDTLVHSISDKLVSPLETLKRRGIPVDRLLKTVQQQPIRLASRNLAKQSSPSQEQWQHRLHDQDLAKLIDQNLEEYQSKSQTSNGFIESLKDLLNPMEYSSSSLPTNSVENVFSQVERNRISHFGRQKSSHEADMNRMIQTSRPYSQTEFHRSEYSRNESNNLCEFVPASDMIRHPTLLHGISLYLDRNVTLTNLMIDQGKQLAWLLAGLAKQVFHISEQTMHLFRDIDSARIAFNSNGALFFNLRYFEQVFADDLQVYLSNATSAIPLVRTIVNFYFIITCHELGHNIGSSHDVNFINRFERILVRFLDAKDAFLSTFSFH